MVETRIIAEPLPPHASDDSRRDRGAELVFVGRVRAEEHGREIDALDYEHYPGMAELELQKLAEETSERFPIGELSCWHRVGRVPVGEGSMRVVIWSAHRKEGLEAMGWFISELKERVPIWKWAITTDGQRLPSHCSH